VDNRTGYSQIWTAPLTVPGRAIKHGSPDLAELEDISPQVKLKFSNTRLDRGRSEISVALRLKNISKDTLSGPVKVRVVQLHSDLGVPTIVGAENGLGGPGAVWDFTPTLPSGVLAPNAESSGKTLTLRLSAVQPFIQGGEWKWELVNFDAQVLGHKSAKR